MLKTVLARALSHLPPQRRVHNQASKCRVPLFVAASEDAVKTGFDAGLEDHGRRCDARDLDQCRLEILQIALGFGERVDHERNDVDVHPRNFRG